ncbi:protein ANTAGONIST OF LIKE HETEROCHROMATIN PROTEIN 1-like [Harpegnathos saltator]|uniref:protein ANTAGONIST OF LIKE HETEROCHROMATIN PROTEIN 1-like n=1 Tax=Harpegnathos saltator TaxID=610380 RepID=UPI000DBED9B3|nr:protein ANTAGONIST OF LIKE HETEROCHROMATIN PROTEIN 1-like [Harpegnathos saltator]
MTNKNIISCVTAVGLELIKIALDTLHTDSNDDEADMVIEKANIIEIWIRVGNRGCYKVREQRYVNEIILRFSNEVFRQHFRMTRTTYENLERRLAPALTRIGMKGRPTISVRTQLLSFSVIRLLATPDSFQIVNALTDIASDVIVWPKRDRLTVTKNRFNEIGVLPDIIGAIDGSHIPIVAPHFQSELCRTRKCQYALTLQAVCDADLVFTNCFMGFPGSVNDCRIFRNSDLWMSVQENRTDFFPGNEYIIADKATRPRKSGAQEDEVLVAAVSERPFGTAQEAINAANLPIAQRTA